MVLGGAMTDETLHEGREEVSEIADDERLLRRIHPTQVDGDRLSSSAFKDPEMSVDRAALLSSPQVALSKAKHASHGLAELVARAARAMEQEVVHDPQELFEPEWAHSLVKGAKPKSIARRLAAASSLIIPPKQSGPAR